MRTPVLRWDQRCPPVTTKNLDFVSQAVFKLSLAAETMAQMRDFQYKNYISQFSQPDTAAAAARGVSSEGS